MKKSNVIARIFTYENYRDFLRDFFKEQKESEKHFTHRYFASLAGFSSSSFCSHVMEGKKNLSQESVEKIILAIGLEGKAADYFRNLVNFNQAKTFYEKEFSYSQLSRTRKTTQLYRLNKNQFAFYDQWYYSVIRELAVYSTWNGDYEKLGNMVIPPISGEKTRKAVNTLLETGLLIKTENNSYIHNSAIASGEEAPVIMLKNLKKEFLFKALEMEEKFEKPFKYSSSATVSMSMESFEKVKKMMDDLRHEILMLSMNDKKVEKVFQANFQMFPLTVQITNNKAMGNEFVS